jgi:hypothetical protein
MIGLPIKSSRKPRTQTPRRQALTLTPALSRKRARGKIFTLYNSPSRSSSIRSDT